MRVIRILCLYIWCLNALARRRGSNLFPSVYEWSHVHIFEPMDTMKRRWEISFHLFCNSFVWSLTKRHINITKTDIEPTRCIFSLHVCDGERLFWKLAHGETIYLNVCVCSSWKWQLKFVQMKDGWVSESIVSMHRIFTNATKLNSQE